ncbi:PH domain-containing protein [Novilysobacter avium]|uniref:PH domain-containing protein n=1 Tax=Novilysobacter avium TaxID=2781023 RepID=A0A7S6UL16_9GAMM|nr:PH domain-containing protein [Lysobacter avium]QOW22251.1 PH domain-containing protein [Lysobacter avium]
MTTDAAAPAEPEHRLHPMSWLFVLVAQLKQFIVPLIALFFFGRRDEGGLWPLIGVGVLAIGSLWQYFTYRYAVAEDALVVRSGLLERSLRVIPFSRIHNVAVEQSVLHRVFGVAEVRLESAGGSKPEATMRVLTLADALELETLVRRRGRAGSASTRAPGPAMAVADDGVGPDQATHAAATTAPEPLLRMGTMDLLRLGVVSNRGMILVGAGVAAFSQTGGRLWSNLFERLGGTWETWYGANHWPIWQWLAGGLAMLAAILLVLRLLSLLLAVLQYYGFVLSRDGRRLTVERGLLTRWRTSASRRRIQAWTLTEGLLHRWLKQRTLEVDTAASQQEGQARTLHELAPIAPREDCDRLIGELLPQARWHALEWQSVPMRGWWRRMLSTLPWIVLVTVALSVRLGGWGLLALAWLPWAAVQARAEARRAGWTLGEELVAVREGWWQRYWRFAEVDKLQALRLTRSPLDRHFDTATLWLDTAGAGARSPQLCIRYLPYASADAVYRRLSSELARRPLRW